MIKFTIYSMIARAHHQSSCSVDPDSLSLIRKRGKVAKIQDQGLLTEIQDQGLLTEIQDQGLVTKIQDNGLVARNTGLRIGC